MKIFSNSKDGVADSKRQIAQMCEKDQLPECLGGTIRD